MIVDGMSNAEYHAHPSLGSTSLKTLARRGGPAKWKWEQAHPRTSDAFDLGTLAHSIILEGDSSSLVVVPVDSKRGKAWTEPAEAARAEGRIPLTVNEAESLYLMRDAVMSHPLAKRAFTNHTPERSIFFEDERTGQALKVRPDALHSNLIVDLKTCADANPDEFGRTAYKYGYYQSAALYQDGVATEAGEILPFIFVNVEKAAPHLVSVVELDDEAIDLGRQMNRRAIDIYRHCAETGQWPGYESTEAIRLPKYAVAQIEGEIYE